MGKSIFIILMSMFIMSCGSGSAPDSNSSSVKESGKSSVVSKKSDGNVLHRVEQIYKDVFAEYSKYDEDFETVDDVSFDDDYCSESWKSLLAKVLDFDSTNHPDDVGFFDADYWVMGQDAEDLSASDFKLIEEKGDHAIVEFSLHNCGHVTKVRLEMVRERGDWFIDNFIDLDYDVNWKQSMEEYLKEQ